MSHINDEETQTKPTTLEQAEVAIKGCGTDKTIIAIILTPIHDDNVDRFR